MRVLVTGASGFLGKHVVKELKRLQYTIDTLGRSNKSTIKVDISRELLPISKQYDLVVHVAGKAHVIPKTKLENKEFYDVNLTGTKNLIKALTKKPNYFVFISSVAVYGLINGIKIKENAELKALDSYGSSKVYAEKIILDWSKKNNICCTILRLPLLVSKNPPGNLGAMLRAIRGGYYFNIGGGTTKKSMVLVKDVVQFIPLIYRIGGVFNLTDGVHPSFKQLSMILAPNKKIFNLPLNFAIILGLIGDFFGVKSILNSKKIKKITNDLTFDDSKARQFGWKPQSVLEYIKNNDF